jgi:hypothetical protein
MILFKLISTAVYMYAKGARMRMYNAGRNTMLTCMHGHSCNTRVQSERNQRFMRKAMMTCTCRCIHLYRRSANLGVKQEMNVLHRALECLDVCLVIARAHQNSA